MSKEEAENSQENKVCNIAADLWNEILKVDNMSKEDISEICKQIHIIQDMMLSKLFTKHFGKL
jgi:hypothetical protein